MLERERLAEALAIERRYGSRATAHIASRVEALALAGDVAGVERWMAISAALQAIQNVPDKLQ